MQSASQSPRPSHGAAVAPSPRPAGATSACGRARLAALALALLLSACASAPLVPGGGLSSYTAMAPSDGLVTKSRLRVGKAEVLAAESVSILPPEFPATAAPTLTPAQRVLVANTVGRALCVALSDRFRVVTPEEPADLRVRAAITRATETNEIAAGVSAAAAIGVNFVNLSVPVPMPRIPIGLGSLSIEAEALDAEGRQQAGMIWGRGATAFFSSPRASKASDAYELAGAFGADFGALLVYGESPFEKKGIAVPSMQKIGSGVGLAPKYAACERFGRAPGAGGFVGDRLGLPPEWTDSGAKPATGAAAAPAAARGGNASAK